MAGHYSQQYLSDQLIVSRPTYERYEKNTVEIPLSKLCLVARLYQIDTLEFLRTILNENDNNPANPRGTVANGPFYSGRTSLKQEIQGSRPKWAIAVTAQENS